MSGVLIMNRLDMKSLENAQRLFSSNDIHDIRIGSNNGYAHRHHFRYIDLLCRYFHSSYMLNYRYQDCPCYLTSIPSSSTFTH